MPEPDTNVPPLQPVPVTTEPTTVKVVQDIPVVFADGVLQHVTSPNVSKFYLHRSDVNPKDPNSFSNFPVIQVIMPNTGFADMVAFLEHRLKVMLHRGDISQAVIDERRDFYSKYPIA